MPTLADIENPPKSRWRDLVIGAFLGIVIIGGFLWFILPNLVATMLGSASTFDQDLRRKDAYMQAICTEAMDISRDQNLCACVLATEVPSLDCQTPFLYWSLERYVEKCSETEIANQSLSFCSCITTIDERVTTSQQAEQNQPTIENLPRCFVLKDAFALPELAELTS